MQGKITIVFSQCLYITIYLYNANSIFGGLSSMANNHIIIQANVIFLGLQFIIQLHKDFKTLGTQLPYYMAQIIITYNAF